MKKDNVVEGSCRAPGWRSDQLVIRFKRYGPNWRMAYCLPMPADLEQAKAVHECIAATFDRLDRVDSGSTEVH